MPKKDIIFDTNKEFVSIWHIPFEEWDNGDQTALNNHLRFWFGFGVYLRSVFGLEGLQLKEKPIKLSSDNDTLKQIFVNFNGFASSLGLEFMQYMDSTMSLQSNLVYRKNVESLSYPGRFSYLNISYFVPTAVFTHHFLTIIDKYSCFSVYLNGELLTADLLEKVTALLNEKPEVSMDIPIVFKRKKV